MNPCPHTALRPLTISWHSYLHVDLLEARNEVSDSARDQPTHPGRRPDADQQDPLLVSLFELLLYEVHLSDKRQNKLCQGRWRLRHGYYFLTSSHLDLLFIPLPSSILRDLSPLLPSKSCKKNSGSGNLQLEWLFSNPTQITVKPSAQHYFLTHGLQPKLNIFSSLRSSARQVTSMASGPDILSIYWVWRFLCGSIVSASPSPCRGLWLNNSVTWLTKAGVLFTSGRQPEKTGQRGKHQERASSFVQIWREGHGHISRWAPWCLSLTMVNKDPQRGEGDRTTFVHFSTHKRIQQQGQAWLPPRLHVT